ncbi:MAG: DUF4394 domain-containing protein [Rubrobacteraceae bacterium]
MKHSINKRTLACGLAASAAAMVLLAVTGSGAVAGTNGPVAPEEVYALTNDDVLLEFDGNNPNNVERTDITGLRGNESLVGIDFRPSNAVGATPGTVGALYGVGDKSNIYIIDEDTGAAERVSQLNDSETGDRLDLMGNNFGVDFNPTVDRLRIVSNTEQNLRVNVDNGDTIVDGDLSYVEGDQNEGENPGVTAVAYTNNQPTAIGGSTELYDIDASLDILAQQVDANAGDLATIGPLGENVKMITGFDVVTTTLDGDQAFAALQRKGVKASGFFSVNLDTGEVSSMGRIDGPRTKVNGLAIPIEGSING